MKQEFMERTNPLTFLTLFDKLKSLQNYGTAENYRLLQGGSVFVHQHNLKVSHHRHI
jgi:hypothetical protein